MVIGLLTLDLHIPQSRSLKDKRQVVRRLIARVRGRFNVSIAEVADHDLHQRAAIAIVSVNTDRDHLESTLRAVADEAEKDRDAQVLRADTEVL